MKKSITLILAIVLCLSLCACGKTDDYEATVVSIDGDNHEGEENNPKETVVTEPKRTEPFEIELTPENFLDFFEYAVEYNFEENAFGEVEEPVIAHQFLRLKEEFVSNFIAGKEIAVEITYHFAWKLGTLDYENKQFIPNGEITTAFGEPTTKVFELKDDYWDYPLACYLCIVMPSSNADAFREIVIDEVLRTKGTLVLSGDLENLPQIHSSYEDCEKTTAFEHNET